MTKEVIREVAIKQAARLCIESGLTLKQSTKVLCTAILEETLKRAGYNQGLAAEWLGIHRNSIARNMAEYAIRTPKQKRKRKLPLRPALRFIPTLCARKVESEPSYEELKREAYPSLHEIEREARR